METLNANAGCECSGPGWCERHRCEKDLVRYQLCQARGDYFRLWEEGRGPGQVRLQPGPNPSVRHVFWNLAESLAAFIADGCKTVSKEQYQQRLEICAECPERQHNTCRRCGCRLSLKAQGRAFTCPLGKWPQLISGEVPAVAKSESGED